MAFLIRLADVEAKMRPWLGSALLSHYPYLCEDVQALLLGGLAQDAELAALQNALEKYFLEELKECTAHSMRIRLDDGRQVRMQAEDIAALADDTLEVLLMEVSKYGAHFERINEFAMHAQSLSALKILYLRYEHRTTPEEREKLRWVITMCYPPWRWRYWLDA